MTRRFSILAPVQHTLVHTTYVLWPPECDPGDTRHLLQAQREESLARLALGARLDLLERSLRGGVLLVVMVVIVVVIMVMVVLLVVGMDLLNGGGHLCNAVGGESRVQR